MTEETWLAERFETHRRHLRDVAYRMLGSAPEAEDAVQEAWLRLSRADTTDVENLGGWLTTVVARVCLDILRSRKSRREESLEADTSDSVTAPRDSNPERELLIADTVGPALLLVLDTLAPAERIAFVLHDMFAMPFEEIAPIVGRSPAAARQLASRGRRRVQGTGELPGPDLERQRDVVSAFLAASREGNFDRLLALLDPEVVLRADQVAIDAAAARRAAGAPGLSREVRGPAAVAKTLSGRAQAARVALVDGSIGAAWAPGGQPRAVFAFRVAGAKIVEIEILADPETLRGLDVKLLDE
jgi:RNA polymerase sigma-70 factor (ECF subfamily)